MDENSKPLRKYIGEFDQYELANCRDVERMKILFDRYDEVDLLMPKVRVYIYSYRDELVFKVYKPRQESRIGDRRYWQRESDALERMADSVYAPRSYGYIEKRERGEITAILCKQFVRGEPFGELGEATIAPMARMFSQMHRRGVTSEDPSGDNFLKTQDGYVFFDLGWARTHSNRISLAYKIGKEMANLRRRVFHGNESLWRRFRREYLALKPLPFWMRLVEWMGYVMRRLKVATTTR